MRARTGMILILTAIAGLHLTVAPADAGATQRHRWEGVAIGLGAAILGGALIDIFTYPYPVHGYWSFQMHPPYYPPPPRPYYRPHRPYHGRPGWHYRPQGWHHRPHGWNHRPQGWDRRPHGWSPPGGSGPGLHGPGWRGGP